MTKSEAEKAGAILIKKLGKGWNLRVWENDSWHYNATRGPIAVYSAGAWNGRPTYYALISDTPEYACGGLPAWSTDGTYRDPRTAVKKAIAPMIKYVAQLNAVCWICSQAFKDFKK
jgi:hypothetical protein